MLMLTFTLLLFPPPCSVAVGMPAKTRSGATTFAFNGTLLFKTNPPTLNEIRPFSDPKGELAVMPTVTGLDFPGWIVRSAGRNEKIGLAERVRLRGTEFGLVMDKTSVLFSPRITLPRSKETGERVRSACTSAFR